MRRKIFILLVTYIMIFSFFAFSACASNINHDDSPSPNDNTSPDVTDKISSISISGGKRAFGIDEDFSVSGLVVTAGLEDGTSRQLDADEYIVDSSRYTDLTEGKYYTIIVTAKDNTDVKAEYKIKTRSDTIKILSIGNSFSADAHGYLYKIIDNLGVYTNIIVGNLYIGGASFALHRNNLRDTNTTAKHYEYQKYTETGYTSVAKNALEAIREETWDFITIQQVSQDCGKPSTLPLNQLQEVEGIIRDNATNSNVQVVWHSTWAYNSESTHSGFPYYNQNQVAMYNAIVDVQKNVIAASQCFDSIIPNSTSIQNARTFLSPTYDELTKDGYHLNVYGKFIAGLMFYKSLSLEDISGILNVTLSNIVGPTHARSEEFGMAFLQKAIKSVNSAFDNPYQITSIT